MRGHICQYADCESTAVTISLNYRNESRPHFCGNEHAALWLLRQAWGRDSGRYKQAQGLIDRPPSAPAPPLPINQTVTSPEPARPVPKPTPAAHVEVTVVEAEFAGDRGMIPGITLTCTKCNHEVHVFGQHERSVKRGMVMMREECPNTEGNFYKVRDSSSILGAG